MKVKRVRSEKSWGGQYKEGYLLIYLYILRIMFLTHKQESKIGGFTKRDPLHDDSQSPFVYSGLKREGKFCSNVKFTSKFLIFV